MANITNEKTMIAGLEKLEGNFWTRLDELVEEIKEIGWTVEEANREYIVVSTEEELGATTAQIILGGTERTIVIASIEWF